VAGIVPHLESGISPHFEGLERRQSAPTTIDAAQLAKTGDYTQNPPFSAQTLPNRSGKEKIKRHKMTRRKGGQFFGNSLKAACLLGFCGVGKSEWVGIRKPLLYPTELRGHVLEPCFLDLVYNGSDRRL